TDFAVIESRGGEVMTMFGIGAEETLETIWIVINWITISFISIGVISLVMDYIRGKKNGVSTF
ncbi:MAG: hypothetical protein MUP73_02290, partial [Dehalococcoidia bacterium]|nr:hypothetical protein [Dehalococcoidia bacterium]